MDIDLDSDREPTHLSGLQKEGVIKISRECTIPLTVIPSIIEAASRTPPNIDNSDLRVMSSQSICSKTGGNCDMCGEELEMDLLLENPEAMDDPEQISLVIITETDNRSDSLIVHDECLEELGSELQQVLDNNPEVVASVGL